MLVSEVIQMVDVAVLAITEDIAVQYYYWCWRCVCWVYAIFWQTLYCQW